MTSEITQNPVKACVFLGGVPLRFALGSSVELGTRSLYAQLAYICYQAIPADDDVDPLSRLGLYSLSGQTNTLPSELSRFYAKSEDRRPEPQSRTFPAAVRRKCPATNFSRLRGVPARRLLY